MREHRRIDQPVVHDQPDRAEQPRGAQGQQIRIARARADEVDCAHFGHGGHMAMCPVTSQRECVGRALGQL
jgi:hypothetical protein